MMGRFVVVAAALSVAASSLADNGEIGRAAPVTGIVIDGDLSDWPDGLQRHAVHLDGDREVQEPSDDFGASFRAGYDAGTRALYIALEVVDDTHSTGENISGDNWQQHDSVIAYVDFNHTTTGSGAALYLAVDAHRFMLSGDSSWDADVAKASWDTAEAAVVRRDNTTIYEWRFEGPRGIAANTVLGLDILINDHDAPGADTPGSLVSWGPGFGKSQAGGRIADLLLVEAGAETATLEGRIALTEIRPEDKPDRHRVRIQSTEFPGLWVQTLAEFDGSYEVELPAGEYTLTSVDRINWVGDTPQVIAPSEPVVLTLKARRATTAPTLALVPVALPVELPERGALFEFSKRDRKAFDEVVVTLMDHFQVPGASVALVNGGKLVHHGTYGTQNAYSEAPVGDNTVFEAASITKAVFAFTVNRMAERGEIDLDKPLYQYLPFEDIAHDERYKKITGRHVLSHQTGFPNWRYMNDDGRIDIKFYPGIQYGYSGEGFEYLGRVVSHIKQEPLETIVRRETLAVMGFEKNTFFAEGPELYEQASRGHWAGMTGPHGFPGEIGVAHSMYTEARTFSNFMIGLLAGKGLSEEGYAKMLEPQVATPTEEGDEPPWPGRFGLGFHMMNSPFGLAYGHGGNNGNFTCQFELYPDHDMGFVVFTNADTGWLLVNALRKYLVIGAPVEPETVAAR